MAPNIEPIAVTEWSNINLRILGCYFIRVNCAISHVRKLNQPRECPRRPLTCVGSVVSLMFSSEILRKLTVAIRRKFLWLSIQDVWHELSAFCLVKCQLQSRNLEKFELSVRGIYPFNIPLPCSRAHACRRKIVSRKPASASRKVSLIVLRSYTTTIFADPCSANILRLLSSIGNRENNEKSLYGVYLSSEKVLHQ